MGGQVPLFSMDAVSLGAVCVQLPFYRPLSQGGLLNADKENTRLLFPRHKNVQTLIRKDEWCRNL